MKKITQKDAERERILNDDKLPYKRFITEFLGSGILAQDLKESPAGLRFKKISNLLKFYEIGKQAPFPGLKYEDCINLLGIECFLSPSSDEDARNLLDREKVEFPARLFRRMRGFYGADTENFGVEVANPAAILFKHRAFANTVVESVEESERRGGYYLALWTKLIEFIRQGDHPNIYKSSSRHEGLGGTQRIQTLILGWLGMQTEATSYAKLRDVCNAGDRILSNYAPNAGERTYSLYEYFYPLARAGLVDCRIQRGREEWALTPPIVLFRDFPDGRRKWVGINLTDPLKEKIEVEVESRLGISRWETSSDVTGDGLPIVQNPSTLQLLKMFPVCRPEVFGTKEYREITRYQERFSASQQTFRPVHGPIYKSGLYRVGNVHSQRVYFTGDRETYTLNQDCKVESDCWAKLRHCIDNDESIATYFRWEEEIQFKFDLPIMLARVLFIEQLFLDEFPDVNSRVYRGITPECFEQLNRIFENNLEEAN